MRKLYEQTLPIFLTILTCCSLTVLLFWFVHVLNLFPTKAKIIPALRIADILVGITIYVKTSIDFALFIGNLMHKYQGYKNRIAIEIGTALGNGIGTFLVLTIWTFFKEVPLLLISMIAIAAMVLFVMAEDSLQELLVEHKAFRKELLLSLQILLHQVNKVFHPVTRVLLPESKEKSLITRTFWQLLFFAFTIPFVLGLDDFAGYIPLFNVVHVVGFATGVFLGHMLLTMLMFASPRTTARIITQPQVMLFGSFAFIGIGLFGFFEIYKILVQLF